MSAAPITRALKAALRARFAGSEWACFFEVPVGTGYSGRDRLADAIAMNMYPSRGLGIHGVEVKASRGDWLRELRAPDKAEAISGYCDYWWIAAPKGMVERAELPPTWGLLELHGQTLRQAVAAPKLAARPLDRSFVASLLRCAAGRAVNELREATRVAVAAERTKAEEAVAAAVGSRATADDYDRLRATVAAFEAASGIQIGDMWGGGGKRIGEAVALVQRLGLDSTFGSIRSLVSSARKFAEDADQALAAFDARKDRG